MFDKALKFSIVLYFTGTILVITSILGLGCGMGIFLPVLTVSLLPLLYALYTKNATRRVVFALLGVLEYLMLLASFNWFYGKLTMQSACGAGVSPIAIAYDWIFDYIPLFVIGLFNVYGLFLAGLILCLYLVGSAAWRNKDIKILKVNIRLFSIGSVLLAFLFFQLFHTNSEQYYEKMAKNELQEYRLTTPKLQQWIDDEKLPLTCELANTAISVGNYDINLYLSEHGLDFKSCEPIDPNYPAFWSEHIDTRFIKLLIDNNLGIVDVDEQGLNFIHHFSDRSYSHQYGKSSQTAAGFTSITKLLMDAGVDINLKDQEGRTPVFIATQDGVIDILEALLKLGADPNIENKKGISPAAQALQSEKMEKLGLLLEYGANITIKGKEQNKEDMLEALNNKKILDRQKRLTSNINYWREYMIAYSDYPKDCEFRILAGYDADSGIVVTDEVAKTTSMFSKKDNFIFGDCSKGRFYHYRITDENNKIISEQFNLHSTQPGQPLSDGDGQLAILFFEDAFKGNLEWFYSRESISSINGDVESNKIKEIKLYVQ